MDVAAPAGKRDKSLVVTLALADLAGVIGPGDRIAQSCEGRQEHRPFELSIPCLEVNSPRMEEPKRPITGASLA
jgi:hypothetical protein